MATWYLPRPLAGQHSSAPQMGECFHLTPVETENGRRCIAYCPISRSRNVEHRAYAGAVVDKHRVPPDSDALYIATHILPSSHSVSFDVSWLLPLHWFQKVCILGYLFGGNRNRIHSFTDFISYPVYNS
jgi:hypothetical protein